MEKMYALEVYEGKECWVAFESDTPFGAISKGDILDPYVWTDGETAQSGMKYEVVDVLHQLWNIKGNRHKIQVFVKAVKWEYPTR